MVDRSSATAFGRVAGSYEQARPSWPAAAIDTAFDHWGLDPEDGLVVDVAAGTGRLTAQLAQRCRRVLAVEPLVEMRAHIRDAPAVKGTAEKIPLGDGEARAIFVGEAFHWFDQGPALAEFARVLEPGGGVALLWNTVAPGDPTAWQQRVSELFASLPPESHSQTAASAPFRDPAAAAGWSSGPEWEPFEPVVHHGFDNPQPLDRPGIVALVGSWSFVARLEPQRQEQFLRDVDEILALNGITSTVIPWRCDLYLTRRR